MQLRELCPELAKIARDELNEKPERIQADLDALRAWIAKQPHLNARTDDQWLVNFLRGCKYSLERTKEKMDMFYTMRTAVPEICMAPDLNESWVQEVLTNGTCVPLPKTLKPSDPKVILIRPGSNDPHKIPTIDTLRVNQVFGTLQVMFDDQSIIAGQRYIIDLANVTMAHFTQMTPSLIKKMVSTGEEALPVRQKGSHFLHTPPTAETVFSIFRRFMNEKNRNRMFVHNNDMEALYKFVPKEILPTEYGGGGGPLKNMIDEWKKHVESHQDWIKDDMKYKTDESKRPGAPKTSETLFGIEGSFRKLNVD